jgi:hypothetical protein
LRALVCPEQSRWPTPDVEVSLKGDKPTAKGLHWERLHATADEARNRVAKAWSDIDEIDSDADLSAEGKARKKKRVASEAIVALEKSKMLASAKSSGLS